MAWLKEHLRVPGLRSRRERDWAQPRRSVWSRASILFLALQYQKCNFDSTFCWYFCKFSTTPHHWQRQSDSCLNPLLAPQSGALRISAQQRFPIQPIPNPLIAFEYLSLSVVIWDSACRPRQINVDQVRPKQVSIFQVSKYPSVQVSQVAK